MADDDLSVLFETFEGSKPPREVAENERDTTWGDYGRALGIGALNVGAGIAAATEYLTDGAVGGETRRTFKELADEQMKETSPAFQRAAGAAFLPETVDDLSIWDVGIGRALAAKSTLAAPSLAATVASVMPVSLGLRLLGVGAAARAPLVGAAAKGSAALQNAGDVAGQIYENVEKLDHDTLMQSEKYRSYIEAGDSQEVAKEKFRKDAVGYAPIIAGAITYMTGGLEGQLGRRIGGEAAKGIIKGAKRGAATEALQEALESGSGEVLTQDALVSEGIGQRNWIKALNAAIEGGVVGGVLGAAGGALGGIGKTDAGPLDPATKFALDQKQQDEAAPPPPAPPASTAAPVTPGVTPTPPTEAPPAGEAAPPAPPAPPRAYNYFYKMALDRFAKQGIELSPEMADELSTRVTEMLKTTSGRDNPARFAAFNAITSDIANRAKPAVTPAPAAPPVQTQQQADEAAMQAGVEALDGPVPERPRTLQEQVKMLTTGDRQAVYIPFTTPEAERPKKPKGIEKVFVKNGIVYYNPARLKPAYIRKADAADRLNDILPMGATPQFEAVKAVKERGADPKVVQVLKDGISVLDAASSSETVAQDVQQIAAQAPADTQVVVRDDPQAVLQERIEGREQDLAEQRGPKIAPKTGRILEAVTNKANQKATNKAIQKNLKEAEAEPKAPRTFKDNEEKAKREADNATAKELFQKWVPENTSFPQTDAERQALFDRLDGMLKEAKERGVKILGKVLGDTVSGELAYLTEARALRTEMKTNKKKVSDDRILTFLGRELAIKKGEVDEVKSERRSEGEMASRQDQGDVDAKADLTEDATPEDALIAKQEAEDEIVLRDEKEVVENANERESIFDRARREALERNKDKIDKIRALANDAAATEGERAAAQDAVRRIEEGGSADLIEKIVAASVVKGENKEGKFKVESKRKIEGLRPKVEGKIALTKKASTPEIKKSVRRTIEGFNPDRAPEQIYRSRRRAPTEAQARALAEENGIDFDLILGGLPYTKDDGFQLQDGLAGWNTLTNEQKALFDNNALEYMAAMSEEDFADNARGGLNPVTWLNNKFKRWDALSAAQRAQFDDGFIQFLYNENPDPFGGPSMTREEAINNGILPGRNGEMFQALQVSTIKEMKRFMMNLDKIENPVLREVMKFVWERIDARIPNMKVLILDEADVLSFAKNADAFYSRAGTTDFIVLSAQKLADPFHTTAVLTHEAMHGLTSIALDNDQQFFGTLKAIADEVRSVIGGKRMSDLLGVTLEERENPLLTEQYGFTDMHEFVAEAFSNPMFQKMLSEIQISDKLAKQLGMQSWSARSLWDAMVNAVRKLLNMPPNTFTALEGVMRVTKDVMAAQRNMPADAQLKAADAMGQFISRDAAMQAARGFAESMTPTTIGNRKKLLAVSTLDQIRQWYRGTFVNERGQDVLEKLISNIQRIRPFADDKRERGEKLAQRFMDFAANNREAANEFADIANSVTMLNANLFGPNEHWGDNRRDSWQARALLPELQRRFAQVENASPGARQLYEDMVAYYRDTQNEITRQLVDNILAEHDMDLSSADRASITKKVMEGTLDDAAKELINNSTIFNALKDARALRLIQGDYFPLMRHGEFVVQTRDTIGDLMGGVEVEPGVIEFTGKTEKDALKMAEAFAKRETKGAGFTKEDGVPLILSGPTAREVSSDSSDYKFRVKVQLDGLHIFDTQAEAESFIQSEKGKYAQISEAPLLKRDDGTFGGELSNSALAAIAKSISAREGISQGQKEMMLTALKQAAVRQMAGNRVQKRALPRRGFIGASSDLARNTLVYAEASTRYLGKLRYMPLVREAFTEMQKLTDAARYTKDHQAMDQIVQHLRARVDGNVVTEQETSPIIRDIMTMSYIDKLASPAYSFLQVMQPTMMTLPYLSGRYGVGQAGGAISQAYRSIGAGAAIGGGFRNTKQAITQFAKAAIDSTDVLGSIMKNVSSQPDGQALTALLNELSERGMIDKNAGMEVAEVVTKGRGKWAMGLSKVDRIARQLPAAVEQVNRAVTAIAAYRLAIESKASPEKAMQMAFDAVANTQGDYSASNAPAIFNHPIWRISLQFKKYGQMYYALFGDMLYRAFKDASPQERAVARKQLAHLVSVQILAAGALGVPGMEVIKIGVMAASALGLGGGYDDFEREVREAAANLFGSKTAGELITKGIIPRAIGLDLSTRLGADSLLTFGEPKKYDETNVGAYLFNVFAGAPGSLVVDQFKAARGFADAIKDGDASQAAKAAELLPLPKFIADTAKAARKAMEGSTSAKSGRQTEDPIGIGTAAINALGFRTADQAERSAAKGAQIAETERRREVTGSMSKLKNQFAEAKNEGERVRVLNRLKQLNATLPEEERQTPAQFRAFAKKFQKDKAAGMVSGGARFRNEAERQASERAAAPYNFAR